jgi:hypothetical protein
MNTPRIRISVGLRIRRARRWGIDGQSGDQQALRHEAADGRDATRRTSAAADPAADLEGRRGGHSAGVVSRVPSLHPAGRVIPQNLPLSVHSTYEY